MQTAVEVQLRPALADRAQRPAVVVAIALHRCAQHLEGEGRDRIIQRVQSRIDQDTFLKEQFSGATVDWPLVLEARDLRSRAVAIVQAQMDPRHLEFVQHTLPTRLDIEPIVEVAGKEGRKTRPAVVPALQATLSSALTYGALGDRTTLVTNLQLLAANSEYAERQLMKLSWKAADVALMQIVALAIKAGLLPAPPNGVRAVLVEPGQTWASDRTAAKYQGSEERKVSFVDRDSGERFHPWIVGRLMGNDGLRAFVTPVFATLLHNALSRDPGDALGSEIVKAAVALRMVAKDAKLDLGPIVVPARDSWRCAHGNRARPVETFPWAAIADQLHDIRVGRFAVEMPVRDRMSLRGTSLVVETDDYVLRVQQLGHRFWSVVYQPVHAPEQVRRVVVGGVRRADTCAQVFGPVLDQLWGVSAITAVTQDCIAKPFDRGEALITGVYGNNTNSWRVRMVAKLAATLGDVLRSVAVQEPLLVADGDAERV